MKLAYATYLLGIFVLIQALGRASRGQRMPWEGGK